MMKYVIALLASLLLVACGDTPDATDNNTEAAATDASQAGSGDTSVEGVAVRTVRNGYGRAVEAGDVLTVHTTGWLLDENAVDKRGEKFWSSLDTGDKLTFTLGAGQMIRGWDVGLPGTLIGEVRELTIPPELAYGAAGRGPIPPNSTLVFEVELFSATAPGEAVDDEPVAQ